MDKLLHDRLYSMRLIADTHKRRWLVHDMQAENCYPAVFICKRMKNGFCGIVSDILREGDSMSCPDGHVYHILAIIRSNIDLEWFKTWYPAAEIDRLQLKLSLFNSPPGACPP